MINKKFPINIHYNIIFEFILKHKTFSLVTIKVILINIQVNSKVFKEKVRSTVYILKYPEQYMSTIGDSTFYGLGYLLDKKSNKFNLVWREQLQMFP